MGEALFDTLYICTGIIIGVYLLTREGILLKNLYGITVLVLILGDSFHLIPRIRAGFSENREYFTRQLAVGKIITSITMTVFYLLLWHIGLLHFPNNNMTIWTISAYILAILRVILCLCPQNEWLHAHASRKWSIYRNIPFLLLGIMVMLQFLMGTNAGTTALSYMWIAIFLSYLFYIPVVLWADQHPAIGMLMLPKTCAYIWIICMGLAL